MAKKKDLLSDTLAQLIPTTWSNELKPVYVLYDKVASHCAEARSYKAVDGVMRWTCQHNLPQ